MTDAPRPERRYGGRTPRERREERRERLLVAGLERFGTTGYAATTIEELCAAASLNPRYFYEQFRNREELLAAVYERHVDAVLIDVRAALAGANADQRLTAGLRAFVEATLADERGARINYVEMVGVSPALEALRRRVFGAYAQLIESEAAALPGLGDADPRMVAVALVGATDGLVTDWLSGPRSGPRSAIVDALLAIFAPLVS